MKISYKDRGFEEFGKLLRELPPNVERNVLQRAVTATLRPIRNELRAVAKSLHKADQASPGSKKYGPLYKNVRLIRLRRVSKGQRAARVDTGNGFWWLFLEFGTRFIPAQSTFGSLIRARENEILDNLGEEIGKGIERQAEKYRGGR